VGAAALGLLGDGVDPADGAWLLVQPVHLRAGPGSAVLEPLDGALLEAAEATLLLEALRPLFEGFGSRWEVAAPNRWYLALDCSQGVPAEAMGLAPQAAIRSLCAGAAGGAWQRLLTEAQMVLHAHPVNEARDARGLPPVNGVLCWGVGGLPGGAAPDCWPLVCSDDPLVRGLGRWSGADAVMDWGAWPGSAAEGPMLAVAPALPSQPSAAAADLQRCQQELLEPAAGALRRGAVDSLWIDPAAGWRCRLARSDLNRFWRRRQDLDRLAQRFGGAGG
jgi:hypothetical protein